jgi:hypothetical protein
VCALLAACSSSGPAPDDPGPSGGGALPGSGGSSIVGGGSAGQPSAGGQGVGGGAGLGGSSLSGGVAGISSGGQSAGSGGSGGSGGSAQTAGTAGTGGVGPGGAGGVGGSAGTGIAGFGGAPVDNPGTIEVGVRNLCPFPLWIHAAGSQATLQPDDAMLATGEIRWYDAPQIWSAARITAYDGGPRTGEVEKAEMTFDAAGVLNYNVTYVDWLGLPIEIESEGGGSDCLPTGCYVPHAQVLTGCPDGLLTGNRCLSANIYCMNPANQSGELCHRLDTEIAYCASSQAECAGASGASTGNAYSCSGWFASSPKWCAALNRGMVDDPDSTNLTAYYTNEPYNTYAQWVHQVCPGIYAFAYDDYPSNVNESGFHACSSGQELRVTFCPAG